jgi:hypothetical protein
MRCHSFSEMLEHVYQIMLHHIFYFFGFCLCMGILLDIGNHWILKRLQLRSCHLKIQDNCIEKYEVLKYNQQSTKLLERERSMKKSVTNGWHMHHLIFHLFGRHALIYARVLLWGVCLLRQYKMPAHISLRFLFHVCYENLEICTTIRCVIVSYLCILIKT